MGEAFINSEHTYCWMDMEVITVWKMQNQLVWQMVKVMVYLAAILMLPASFLSTYTYYGVDSVDCVDQKHGGYISYQVYITFLDTIKL